MIWIMCVRSGLVFLLGFRKKPKDKINWKSSKVKTKWPEGGSSVNSEESGSDDDELGPDVASTSAVTPPRMSGRGRPVIERRR